MRILDFIFRSAPGKADSAAAVRRSAAPHGATRAAGLGDEGPHTQPAHQRPPTQQAERAERRELLYGVVRETMMRAGILSSYYKFKVLSLDVRGRQFLVMMDLAPDAVPTGRLSEIETLMVQAAKARHDMTVTSVYWRTNSQIVAASAAPLPARPPVPAATASMAPVLSMARPTPVSAPMPLDIPVDERTTEPAALTVMDRRSGGQPLSRFEPIEADEVAAFKRALVSAGRSQAPATGVLQRSGRRNPAPMGFEDTQPPDGEARDHGLSATQYGALN